MLDTPPPLIFFATLGDVAKEDIVWGNASRSDEGRVHHSHENLIYTAATIKHAVYGVIYSRHINNAAEAHCMVIGMIVENRQCHLVEQHR